MMSYSGDPESERKRLLALLIEGMPIVVIDNVERPLVSDALCSILTEPMYSDRLLGVSQISRVPTNCMFCATGNNVILQGDLTKRALICGIDPQCEHPEERDFAVDLHEYVPAHRGELVAAALTIPMAYTGDWPKSLQLGLKPFGRFEAWSRWCREPLVWLDMPDPCLSRRAIENRDPVHGNLRTLLSAWNRPLAGHPTRSPMCSNVSREILSGWGVACRASRLTPGNRGRGNGGRILSRRGWANLSASMSGGSRVGCGFNGKEITRTPHYGKSCG